MHYEAYNNQAGVILSPDDVWITIHQGLSMHINKYSEELRDKCVDFQGKKTITVKVNELDWELILKGFENKLSEYVKGNYSYKIIADFTTSTDFEIAMSRIGLMS